jgi:hypothetical protein
MPRKDIEMEHPMAGRGRRAKKILDDSQEIFDKLDQAEEEAKQKAEEPISPKKLKSLRELLFLGAATKDVEIDGFIFTLHSLSNEENRSVLKKMLVMEDEDRLVDANIYYVAESLRKINHLEIHEAYSEIFEEEPSGTRFDMSLKILSSMSMHMGGTLIKAYFDLSEESKKILSLEETDSIKK